MAKLRNAQNNGFLGTQLQLKVEVGRFFGNPEKWLEFFFLVWMNLNKRFFVGKEVAHFE